MRYSDIKKDTYYSIENTGAGGMAIFRDKEDCVRFLFLILHYVSPTLIHNSHWYISMYIKKNFFSIGNRKKREILEESYIELIAFSIYEKGFRLLIRNLNEGAASVYMQRIQTSYAKYFNSKYKKKGHVFNGPFIIRECLKNKLLEISASIHNISIPFYSFSSLHDYTKNNRWAKFLSTTHILKQFKNQTEYRLFLDKSRSPKTQ